MAGGAKEETMGQCGEITDPRIECCQPAVLYGKCEAHLSERERAELKLVRAAEVTVENYANDYDEIWNALRRAIAAVREEK